MFKIFSLLLIFFSFNIYALDVNSLFNLESNGDIVYYDGSSSVDSGDYIKADKIKSKLESKNLNVHSIVIADILSHEGNEFIALVSSINGNSIFIYNNKTEDEFSYTTDRIGDNASLDLETFFDKKSEINIIKYYVLKTDGVDRDIYAYMFRIEDNKIKFLTDISFYKEINSKKSSVIQQLDNIFVDIDEDGIYEMLVEAKEKVSGRSDRVEYQVYKLNKKRGKYECIVSSWLEDDSDVDYSVFFNKR